MMDSNSSPDEASFITWTCPHCGSIWSHELNKDKACDSFLCHATNKPYVIVFDKISCVCCDGDRCFVKWQRWNRQSIASKTKIPMIYARVTTTDQTFKTRN